MKIRFAWDEDCKEFSVAKHKEIIIQRLQQNVIVAVVMEFIEAVRENAASQQVPNTPGT